MCELLGQYDKSQRYFQQLLNDEHNEDRALLFKGQWEEAITYYNSTYNQMINNKPPRIKDSAYVLNNIGLILHKQEKYDEALDSYQRALKMYEKHYPSSHVDIAFTLNNIGFCYKGQNITTIAPEYYQRALTVCEKFLRIEHSYRVKIDRNVRRLRGKQ